MGSHSLTERSQPWTADLYGQRCEDGHEQGGYELIQTVSGVLRDFQAQCRVQAKFVDNESYTVSFDGFCEYPIDDIHTCSIAASKLQFQSQNACSYGDAHNGVCSDEGIHGSSGHPRGCYATGVADTFWNNPCTADNFDPSTPEFQECLVKRNTGNCDDGTCVSICFTQLEYCYRSGEGALYCQNEAHYRGWRGNSISNVDDTSACRDKCWEDPQCRHYVYNERSKICKLSKTCSSDIAVSIGLHSDYDVLDAHFFRDSQDCRPVISSPNRLLGL